MYDYKLLSEETIKNLQHEASDWLPSNEGYNIFLELSNPVIPPTQNLSKDFNNTLAQIITLSRISRNSLPQTQ